MTYYIYITQRENANSCIREILAVENKITINDKEINNNNKFGIIFIADKTQTFNYYTKINVNNLKELKKELEKIVEEKELSLKYIYNNKIYLILAKKKKTGVWKDNDLIIHQVRPHQIINYNKHILIGNKKENEEIVLTHEFVKYYKEWEQNLKWMLANRYEYNYSLIISFILTFNKYLSQGIKAERAITKDIYHNKIIETEQGYYFSSIGKTYSTKEQFEYYISPSYYGKEIKQDFYSSLSAFQLNYAYQYFISDFLEQL